MAERIKIAQIGVGHMHAYKIKTLRQLSGVFDVAAVAEDDPVQRAAFGNQEMYRGLKWMTEPELLAVPGLQAVLVDNGLAVFEYPRGCTATVRTSVVEVEGFRRRNLTVCGDRGTIVIQPLEITGDTSGGNSKPLSL